MRRIRKEIIDLLSLTPSADSGSFEAEIVFPAEFIGFQGHFPANPIVPGVVVIGALTAACEKALGMPLKITGIEKARFLSPITPGMKVKMHINPAPQESGYLVKAKLTSDRKKISSVTCTAVSDT